MADHPDAEALSAHYDGEAPELAPHVETCPSCQAQLARLVAVTTALNKPVAPMRASALHEAVQRGLASTGPVTGAAPVAPVRGLSTRRSRRLWAIVASGAAVLISVAMVGLLSTRGGDGPETTAAGPGPATTDTRDFVSGAEMTALPGAPVEGGNLGDFVDGPSLLSRIQPVLSKVTVASTDRTLQAPSGAESREPSLIPRQTGTRACEPEARERRPGLGEVVYVARGLLQGKEVFVLAFATPGGQRPFTLLVMTQSGCQTLLDATVP